MLLFSLSLGRRPPLTSPLLYSMSVCLGRTLTNQSSLVALGRITDVRNANRDGALHWEKWAARPGVLPQAGPAAFGTATAHELGGQRWLQTAWAPSHPGSCRLGSYQSGWHLLSHWTKFKICNGSENEGVFAKKKSRETMDIGIFSQSLFPSGTFFLVTCKCLNSQKGLVTEKKRILRYSPVSQWLFTEETMRSDKITSV